MTQDIEQIQSMTIDRFQAGAQTSEQTVIEHITLQDTHTTILLIDGGDDITHPLNDREAGDILRFFAFQKEDGTWIRRRRVQRDVELIDQGVNVIEGVRSDVLEQYVEKNGTYFGIRTEVLFNTTQMSNLLGNTNVFITLRNFIALGNNATKGNKANGTQQPPEGHLSS